MKRPLLSFAVFCSVFFGIVIFCVIFGGYTNLLRAQNRIKAAKELVTTQCQKRLDLLPELITMAEKTLSPEGSTANNPDQVNIHPINIDPINIDRITETAKEAKAILTQINSIEDPFGKELILTFEQSQVRLGQEISFLISNLKKDDTIKTSPALLALEYDFEQLGITVFVSSSRYNKEARYFNTKKAGFFGFFIAKLFGLEETHFFEITASLFKLETKGADTGAS